MYFPFRFRRCEMQGEQPIKHVVYILELEHSRWYVGRTTEHEFAARMQQQQMGHAHGGALFTSRFKPVPGHVWIVSAHYDEHSASQAEASTALNLMAEKGVDFVRGAQWSELEFSEERRATIERSVDQLKNRCYVCHQSGHTAAACPSQPGPAAAAHHQQQPVAAQQYGQSHAAQMYLQGYGPPVYQPVAVQQLYQPVAAQQQYVPVAAQQQYLPVAGQLQHFSPPQASSGLQYGYGSAAAAAAQAAYHDQYQGSDSCYRCGRSGHWASHCNARTHVSGHPL